jgi:hypothetical protein
VFTDSIAEAVEVLSMAYENIEKWSGVFLLTYAESVRSH